MGVDFVHVSKAIEDCDLGLRDALLAAEQHPDGTRRLYGKDAEGRRFLALERDGRVWLYDQTEVA